MNTCVYLKVEEEAATSEMKRKSQGYHVPQVSIRQTDAERLKLITAISMLTLEFIETFKCFVS
jgi:hypothetical protein